MRVKNIMLTIGVLSMMGTTALSASNGYAVGPQRVDVIDSLPAGWQWDSMKTGGDQVQRVDVIESIRSEKPVYRSTSGTMRVDVIENIRVTSPSTTTTK